MANIFDSESPYVINGQLWIGSRGTQNPSAGLQLGPGTAASNSSPLKFTAGTNLTTPEDGAMEYDGTELFFTVGTTRKAVQFGGSAGGTLVVAPTAVTSGTQTALTVTGAANTGLTASTEVPDFNINLARTLQWATGALTTQRAVLVQAPTYEFVGASTITNAATLAITGAPVAGTNATITNSYALWVQGGLTELDGGLKVTGSTTPSVVTQSVATTGSPTAILVTGGAHTTLTASTEAIDINWNLSRTVQFSTGAITTQRAVLIQAPTYAFVGASTITNAATLDISGAPVAGTNATITNAYALRVEGGLTLLAGGISVTGAVASSINITGANLTLQTSTSGTLAVTSAGLLTLTGVGASVWTPGAGATIVSDATTGIKIGTATTQKLGFYNATPVVQPAASSDATGFVAGGGTTATSTSTWTGASGASAYTVGGIVTQLKALGLLAA